MLNFLGKSQPKKTPDWSPPNERTVINNVACMLPPNLSQDTIHFFLLRFRLEEIEHYLHNLTDEIKYLQYYEPESPDQTDSKSRYPPDVKIRFQLIKERSKLIQSILQVYPPYIYKDDDFLPCIDFCQEVKEIYLNTNEQISKIIGVDGGNIKRIEQQFNVKILLLDVPLSLKNAPDSIYKESLCRLSIKGDSKEEITDCFQYIQNILESKESEDISVLPKNKESTDNNPPAPWEIDNNLQSLHEAEEERNENDQNLLNPLLTDKNPEYLSFMQNQKPPGS